MIFNRRIPKARAVSFWRQPLRAVPDFVWNMRNLEVLILAETGLSELPRNVALLRNLQTLDLGHNGLTDLPEELGLLTQLSGFLYLHDNRLSSLPDSLNRLEQLQYLNLSGNIFC